MTPDLEALKALLVAIQEVRLRRNRPEHPNRISYAEAEVTRCAYRCEKALERLLASQGKPEAEAASQEPSSGAPVTADVEPASLGAATELRKLLSQCKRYAELGDKYSVADCCDDMVKILDKHQPIKAAGK